MFNASQQCGNGTSAGGKYKNVTFRPVQTVPIASHASVDMEKLPVDVEECGVSDSINWR